MTAAPIDHSSDKLPPIGGSGSSGVHPFGDESTVSNPASSAAQHPAAIGQYLRSLHDGKISGHGKSALGVGDSGNLKAGAEANVLAGAASDGSTRPQVSSPQNSVFGGTIFSSSHAASFPSQKDAGEGGSTGGFWPHGAPAAAHAATSAADKADAPAPQSNSSTSGSPLTFGGDSIKQLPPFPGTLSTGDTSSPCMVVLLMSTNEVHHRSGWLQVVCSSQQPVLQFPKAFSVVHLPWGPLHHLRCPPCSHLGMPHLQVAFYVVVSRLHH